jgi:peptidoglycan/LPS O-acetylase OafA/YrhL
LIRSLQAGRALAALAVVLYHACSSTAVFTAGMPAWLKSICERGYLGVDFFFVLSGFIIAHTRNHHQSFSGYARRRLTRVFVPYWPIGIVMGVAYLLLPDLSHGDRDWSWAATLTLLPATGAPALNVAWTLQFELLFYLFFGIAMALRHPLLGVLPWGAAVLLFNAVAGPPSAALAPFLDLIVVEFVIGVIAAYAVATDRLQNAAFLGLATLAIYFGLGAVEPHRLVFGLAMGFVVVAIVRAERAGHIRVPAALTLLGTASYSIYLVHNPVVALSARLFDNWAVTFALASCAGVAAGVGYHLGFEKPLLRLLRGKRRPAPALPPAPQIAAQG